MNWMRERPRKNEANLPGDQVSGVRFGGWTLPSPRSETPCGVTTNLPAMEPLEQTRRPQQESPRRVSTRVSGPISRISSVEPDFCRARQTSPI